MKHLVLIRHAKSDWSMDDTSDFDRPLNIRGVESTAIIGQRILQQVPCADLILASAAKRTVQTMQRLTTEINYYGAIEYKQSLYLADIARFEMNICSVADTVQTLWICAHNPGITEYVNMLAHTHIINMPTCGVAYIQLAIQQWSDIFTARGELKAFDYPKRTVF